MIILVRIITVFSLLITIIGGSDIAASFQVEPVMQANFFGVPIQASIVLDVCPHGPPECNFTSIQKAIEEAPPVRPFLSWSNFDEDNPLLIPLIRVAPGEYEENLIILKGVWLQGKSHENTLIRNVSFNNRDSLAPSFSTIFATTGVVQPLFIEQLDIEGGLEVQGSFTGIISNNIFSSGENTIAEVSLSGNLNILIQDNIIEQSLLINNVSPLFELLGGGINDDESIALNNNVLSAVLRSAKTNIEISNARDVSIFNNSIENSEKASFSDGVGISVSFSDNIRLNNNLIERKASGIIIDRNSTSVSIVDNQLINNSFTGITLHEGLVQGNDIQGNDESIGISWLWHTGDEIGLIENNFQNHRISIEASDPALSREEDFLQRLSQLNCQENSFLDNENDFAIFLGTASLREELKNVCNN